MKSDINIKNNKLYILQEKVLQKLFSINDPQLTKAKFCGGTALARAYLDHRVSYDLDFFFKPDFDSNMLLTSLKKAKINYELKDIVSDSKKANQLHGSINLDGELLKVSFVEDMYFDLYPSVIKEIGNTEVITEPIEGLYHRKLRTISGPGGNGDSFDGGRQKARDVFDLYVLSKEHMPLNKFIESLPFIFPTDSFNNGLSSMPWFDLIPELNEINCDSKYKKAMDVSFLSEDLFKQIESRILIPSQSNTTIQKLK